MTQLLRVKDLSVVFARGSQRGISGVSFDLAEMTSAALVGESGSGKTLTALSILRLLPPAPACVVEGQVLFQGTDLLQLSDAEMRRIRGAQLAMAFQEPSAALDPTATVAGLLTEPIRAHLRLSRAAMRQKAEQTLALVGVPTPKATLNSFPHELSGGMRQRVMLAMALSCNPKLLIADQPASGIDPTTQMELMDVLGRIQTEHGMGLLIITHNLALAAVNTTTIFVMYAGQVVESGSTASVLTTPAHPYTRALLDSIPPPRPQGTVETRRLPVLGLGDQDALAGSGCRFRTRCPLKPRLDPSLAARCEEQAPPLRSVGKNSTRCHHGELVS